jgi:hypothetical protein
LNSQPRIHESDSIKRKAQIQTGGETKKEKIAAGSINNHEQPAEDNRFPHTKSPLIACPEPASGRVEGIALSRALRPSRNRETPVFAKQIRRRIPKNTVFAKRIQALG